MNTNEKHLIFGVHDQLFTVNVSFVNSIIQLPRVFKVPQAPEYILGIINVEGDVIPVVDTGIKLNMDSIPVHKRSQVIIMQLQHEGNANYHKLGFLVSNIDDVAEVNPHKLQALPTSNYHFDERLVEGVHKIKGEFCMQVNVQNFYKEEIDLITIN